MEGVDYVEVVTRNCVPVDIICRMEGWGTIEWVGGGRLYDSHFDENNTMVAKWGFGFRYGT